MASPMYEAHPELAQVAIKYFSRAFQGPIDDTTVWNTVEDVISYARQRATYAYPGQIITVLNKTEDGVTRDPSTVVIREDGTTQILGKNVLFESMDLAKSWLVTNAGYEATPGTVCIIKYALADGTSTFGLFCVNDAMDDFYRVSFNQEDIPEVTWDDLVNNPFSEDEDGKLQYTDKAGEVHKVAYTTDLNKPPVLEDAPAEAETGSVYYQKI